MKRERTFSYSKNMPEDPGVQKISKFYRDRKRMPSYSEIMKLAGYASKSAAFKLVCRLVDEDFLKKDSAGKLLPGRLFHAVKVLGTVEAGWPTTAEEQLIDTISLDEFLIANKDATYMLTVNGDSMKNAGILSGDMVLVERANDARDGAIVVAEVDGQWTMKYLRRRGRQVFLEPANELFSRIVPRRSLKIAAIVKAVIRKYYV